MQIYSFSPFGYEGSLVSVEVDLRRGIPAVDIVGLADGAVKESRERMASAIRNSGFEFPPERVLISLSPADLKKEGAGFDLAVALAVLHEKKKAEQEGEWVGFTDSILVIGELELNGHIKSVRGIHAAVVSAQAGGISMCIVPAANCQEARQVAGMKVFGAQELSEAFEALEHPEVFLEKNSMNMQSMDSEHEWQEIEGIAFAPVETGYEFSEIKNQKHLIRGLQIAAAGGHNLLAYGPPGCGKTLALQRFPSLLPLLTVEEAQSVTRIHSIAGLLSPQTPLMQKPPFRMPHQTATIEGICGGGPKCLPGEISLAHKGVLFLDEAAEFKTSVLQMLRVPLESSRITLSRAGRTTTFPADFQLLLATNPCPCGNYGSRDRLCLCSSRSVEQYWKKFSGPLLDRIDIRIQAQSSIQEPEYRISTQELRIGIARAIKIQRKRQGKRNQHLTPGEMVELCKTTEEANSLLQAESEKNGFSPRAVSGCLKVARTIADMEQKDVIQKEHIKEAVSFRKTDGAVGDGWCMA